MSDIPKMVSDTLATSLAARSERRKATLAEIGASVGEIAKRTHAGAVMVFTAAAENHLRSAILTKMRGLSGRREARIFENYGPLGSFSAKIEVSFALQIITRDIATDLKIIKDIRNEFAHTTEYLDFHSEAVAGLMRNISGFDPNTSHPEELFFERVNTIIRYLAVIINRAQAFDDPPGGVCL